MNPVAVCTDSSSLLSASAAASLRVDMVPVPVALDGEPFDEDMSSLDWFYERLRTGAAATTSQPSPAELLAAYDLAASRGARAIVSVHLDSRVSGTVSSAETAAHLSQIPVTVVDTRTVSFGVGVCVRAAAEVVAGGGSAGDAALAASRLGARMHNAFVARESRGGRVPAVGGWTLFRFADGAAEPIWECASEDEAVERMADLAIRDEQAISAAVGHAGRTLEPAADQLAHRLVRAGVTSVERYRVGASVGAHTGPDSFGIFWWPAVRSWI
jgi:DegV family protein with EDD domain